MTQSGYECGKDGPLWFIVPTLTAFTSPRHCLHSHACPHSIPSGDSLLVAKGGKGGGGVEAPSREANQRDLNRQYKIAAVRIHPLQWTPLGTQSNEVITSLSSPPSLTPLPLSTPGPYRSTGIWHFPTLSFIHTPQETGAEIVAVEDNNWKVETRGMPGQQLSLQLILRVVADIGIVGFPNAGME